MRSHQDSPPSRSRSRSPIKPKLGVLGQHLFSKLKRGIGLDVIFLVGVPPHQTRVGAHKAVLIAMSDVFETKLEERWTPGDTIELPQEISENAVHAFIKYMYIEEIDAEQTTEILLQVLILADMYNVLNLLEKSEELLDKRIEKDNCAQIFESTFLITSCKKFSQAALFVLNGFVGELLREKDEDACRWLFSTWEQILQSSLPNVEEVTLFEGLVRWLNYASEERKKDFDKLLKLIRFPLMGSDSFVKKVIPSGVLSQDDIYNILVYFSLKEKQEIRFSSKPRNIILAPDTSSFKRLLTCVAPGDTIQLAEATYDGPFEIDQNDITIIGAGTSKTIITNNDKNAEETAGILVNGDNCKISGLEIISETNAETAIQAEGNHNVFQDLLLDGTQYGLGFLGNFNCASNIVATNIEEAFYVDGDSNKLTTLEARNVKTCYAHIKGDNNLIKDFTYFDSLEMDKTGISVLSGNMNEIDGMNFSRTASVQNYNIQRNFYAVKLSNGNEHVIKGVKYEGYLDNINPICIVSVKELCANSVISDCCSTRIHIRGGQNHRIVDCKAKVFKNNGTNVQIVNCNFGSVTA